MSRPDTFTLAASLRTFAVIVTILGVLYLTLAFAVGGVFSSWLFHVAVVQPVEARYGFDAEWKKVGEYDHLVIASVTPNSRFHRAGVRAGYAFAPARCGWFAMGGGWYALLGNAKKQTHIVLETTPGDISSERQFIIR